MKTYTLTYTYEDKWGDEVTVRTKTETVQADSRRQAIKLFKCGPRTQCVFNPMCTKILGWAVSQS